MAKIVSFINLKGGFGKTTITVNIASLLAKVSKKRVLLIDLDPQTNATVSLISQPEWQRINNIEKQTLYYLFRDKLENAHDFDINRAIIKNVADCEGLDLLPSSLNLVEIQDRIPEIGTKAFINHIEVLQNELAPLQDQYDYILIDCPPNLGAITLNGITMSDYYIIPTTPDILSKIGISLIKNRIDDFKNIRKTCKIQLAGIVFTKVDYRTNLHASTISELRGESYPLSEYIFTNELPLRISIAEAPVDNRPHITSTTARQKKDWKQTQRFFSNILNEMIHKISTLA
jgi:chromosome partitioning protein